MKITGGGAPTEAADYGRFSSIDVPHATPLAFGAGTAKGHEALGHALSEGSQELFRASVYQQGLLNENLAKDADVAATTQLLNLQFDPKDGFMSKKGRTAVETYEDTLNAAKQIRTDTLNSLPNDQAKKMFDQVFLRRLQYSMEGIGAHASRENLSWMKNTSIARESNLASEGALNWNNFSRFVDTTIPAITAEVTSRTEMEGYAADSDYTKHAVQMAVDSAHVLRLKSMVRVDPAGAVSDMQRVSPYLSAVGKVHAEEAVMTGIRLAHAQLEWAEQANHRAIRANDESLGQKFFDLLGRGKLDFDTINASNMSAPNKVHWFNMVNTQNKAHDRLENNNPLVVSDLLRRMELPYGNKDKLIDPHEIYAKVGHGVSLGAGGTLVKMLTDARTPEGQRLADVRKRFFDGVRPQFVHDTNLGPDIQGGKDFFEFQQAVFRSEEQRRMVEKKDPMDLYDDTKPEYVGNRVASYRASFVKRLDRQLEAIRGSAGGPAVGGAISGAAPKIAPDKMRRENENIDQWIERTSRGGSAK